MTEIAVTDTDALLWYALSRRAKLGNRARAFFGLVSEGRAAVYVPAITLVELLEAEHRGVIALAGGTDSWIGGFSVRVHSSKPHSPPGSCFGCKRSTRSRSGVTG